MLWYNSAGDFNSAPQTPRNLLLTHESRVREFKRLKAMGVAGLKIDFFGGDGQSMINYYLDILEDAEPFGFLINFHGATLPRGWQRTYPHLMTVEAIRGLEFVTFEQKNAADSTAKSGSNTLSGGCRRTSKSCSTASATQITFGTRSACKR